MIKLKSDSCRNVFLAFVLQMYHANNTTDRMALLSCPLKIYYLFLFEQTTIQKDSVRSLVSRKKSLRDFSNTNKKNSFNSPLRYQRDKPVLY